MAGHIRFENLRDGDGIKEEQFFLETIPEMETKLLAEFNKYMNGKKTEYKIQNLPDEYIFEEDEKTEGGYKAYGYVNVKCSQDAVWGGRCCVELHYKSKNKYRFYAVA